MDNVPSSVIFFVLCIIIAAVLGSFFILFYHSNAKVTDKGSQQMESDNLAIEDLKVEKDSCSTVKGSSVVRLIRMVGGKDISIQGKKKNDTLHYTAYNRFLQGTNADANGAIKDIEKPAELSEAEKSSTDRLNDYTNAKNGDIELSEDYDCRVLYSESSNAPIGLIFTRS